MFRNTKGRKCEVMEDSDGNSARIAQSAIGLPQEFFGIFGMVDFPSGPYLILIERASIIGEILFCHVFRVEQLMFVPLNNAVHPFTVRPIDQPFVDMI